MSRKLTPRSSLENLKREAKRWLSALRENDPAARARLERALGSPIPEPTLRDVQLALAREHGAIGWSELKAQLAARELAPPTSERDEAVQQLLIAAGRGDASRVIALLDAHPDIVNERANLPGNTGKRTALHFAIGPDKVAVVDALLEHGADPNIRDDGDNAMPIHFAAERGDLEVVKRLIEHGADPIGEGTVHELDALGWATSFSYAFHRDVAEYLLAHGAHHTIFSAVAMGATEVIREIVARDRSQLGRPMDQTNRRRRPLHLAVIKKQRPSLEALLDLGAETEVVDSAGLTPLDQAALQGEGEMARILIEHGARIQLPAAIALGRMDDIERLMHESPGDLGPGGRWRALIIRAAEQAPGAVIEALIRHGASVDAQDDAETAVDSTPSYTPLHAAAFSGNADAVRVLLAHGANVRSRDGKYHATPAGWADYAGHPKVRDMILEGPIDLFDAVAFDRVDRMQGIFEAHTSLNQPIQKTLPVELSADDRMKPWWTPLAYAIVHGKTDAARELLRLGARTTVRDSRGPRLRDLAVEHGRDEIVRMIDEQETRALAGWTTDPNTHAGRVVRFLTNACPDHHVRGGSSHRVARDTALRLLEQDPEIADASIFTAVVCGEIDLVRTMLEEHPELATTRGGPKGSYHVADMRFVVDPVVPTPPLWDPLLYLSYARLPLSKVNDNAVAIAGLLLDDGADPNTYFMAGDARYSALSGVIGEGEEAHKAHPKRDELVRLLLEYGADPYDVQVFYNTHFHGDILWYLRLIYEQTTRTGRARDWADPEWRMIDMGGYGYGARFLLGVAVNRNDVELARWILEHGATANPGMGRALRGPRSLHQDAVQRGHLELAELLARFGAETSGRSPGPQEQFVSAAMRLDRPVMQHLVADHPELRLTTKAMFEAAEKDRDDVVAALLDLGTSPDVEDEQKQRPLHVAAYANSLRVARLLIDRGAAIDPVEANWGNTPIDAAIYADHAPMIDLLAGYSRDVWSLTFTGKADRLREVLESEPARARISWNGWTLLMRLPGDERLALHIAQMLLDRGADPRMHNSDGLTAAEIASARGLESVATLLRDAEETSS